MVGNQRHGLKRFECRPREHRRHGVASPSQQLAIGAPAVFWELDFNDWLNHVYALAPGLAVRLEHRYKGLRSPHKLKSACSGCARECAEAQSKDIGVIATERGWNLYVCGNGGMRPRHADLFATDLDEQTLIRYIDRLLMFYVRTGDRLQRTSVWMENMEGGLDYLKSVIIEDRLGIGAELEAMMGEIVGTWQCEWKSTLADPDKLKLFEAFVNRPEDETPPRREERGQWVPDIAVKEVV
jgi:nitrite reductase (NADH) large subunit